MDRSQFYLFMKLMWQLAQVFFLAGAIRGSKNQTVFRQIINDEKYTRVDYSQNVPDIANILAFNYDSHVFSRHSPACYPLPFIGEIGPMLLEGTTLGKASLL